MNEEKKMENTERMEIPAELLLNSVDEVNNMVSGHVLILEAVKSLLHKYVQAGIPHNDAAKMAIELNSRAAQKANKLVKHSDEEMSEENQAATDEEMQEATT